MCGGKEEKRQTSCKNSTKNPEIPEIMKHFEGPAATENSSTMMEYHDGI